MWTGNTLICYNGPLISSLASSDKSLVESIENKFRKNFYRPMSSNGKIYKYFYYLSSQPSMLPLKCGERQL